MNMKRLSNTKDISCILTHVILKTNALIVCNFNS